MDIEVLIVIYYCDNITLDNEIFEPKYMKIVKENVATEKMQNTISALLVLLVVVIVLVIIIV